MKKLNFFLLNLFILSFSCTGYCQFLSNTLFLDRAAINKYHIDTIKVFDPPIDSNQVDSGYTEYHFQQGLLVDEQTFNTEMRGFVGYAYDSKMQLTDICTQDDITGHQCNFEHYKYLNGKVQLTLTGVSGWSNIKSVSLISGLARWFYYPDGRIKYLNEYWLHEIDENEIADLKFQRLMKMPESAKHPFLVRPNDLLNPSKHYFITYQDYILGDYWDVNNTTDTLEVRKMQRLKASGFDSFGKKTYPDKVYQQVIADNNAGDTKSETILVNGKSLKSFLLKIGKSDTKFIILKQAEDRYVFYKII